MMWLASLRPDYAIPRMLRGLVAAPGMGASAPDVCLSAAMNPNPSGLPRVSAALLRVFIALSACGLGASRLAAQAGTPPPSIVDRPLTPPSNDSPDEQPSSQHVWIPGHWRWGQGSYVWVAGRWELPPVPNATWIAPQWQQQGSGYVLHEGYWQQNPPPADVSAAVPTIAASQPPPPPQPEPIPEQPSPDYVWQPGYWDWRGNQFFWVNGHWELPPRQNLVWVPAHWETRGNQYVLTAGYWRENQVPTVVSSPAAPTSVVVTQPAPAPQVVVVAPPAPPQEVVYRRPSPYHVWVPGFWAWRGGRYVWIGGHWERPPYGRRSWEAPRWERRGNNYVFIEGHWR